MISFGLYVYKDHVLKSVSGEGWVGLSNRSQFIVGAKLFCSLYLSSACALQVLRTHSIVCRY